MRHKLLNEIALKYLKDKGLNPETASEAQKSDAKSYSSCYQWYLDTQKVMTNTAELASDVWVSKYALHNTDGICLENTPEDMWDRISSALACEEIKTNHLSKLSFDEWKSEFFNLLTEWKYVPGGSGLYALGNEYVESSASNCFVWDGSVHGDSLEGIMETAKNMSTIYKYRGGCGIDISHLRPEGSAVSNAAKTSSGAASFMDFFSTVTATVGQCNRRGALMQSIRVDHPDIFKFIEEKKDKDKQWFFNELLDSGINLNEFKYFSITQRLKSTSNANVSVKLTDKFIKAVEDDTDFELWYEFEDNKYPRISKIVRAMDIWNALISAATESAEPGMFNWDYLLHESVTDSYSSKTRHSIVLDGILTDVTYSSKTISTNPCLSGDTLVSVADGRGSVTIKELAESGEDVPVYCLDSSKRIAIRMMRNPRITGYNQPMIKLTFEGNHEVKCTLNHKILMSDGHYKEAKDISVGDCTSAFYKEDEWSDTPAVDIGFKTECVDNAIFVHKTCETCGKTFKLPYEEREICFCSIECSLVYLESSDFDVEVYDYDSTTVNRRVVSIEYCDTETVYNGTVDEFHNFFIGCFDELNGNGNRKLFHINNLNCGELPLSHGDSCCLGSFYLPAFVKDAWTENAHFDFNSFIDAVKLGTRAQDNIKNIDLDKVPLKENKIAGILLRRIGLGCHGLADMLASLGLKYDTDEAVEFAASVYETLKNTVYSTSVVLGQEKGVAPIWEWELEKDNPFLNRLNPEVLQSIKDFGRRNIACLTNAPTGSLSILSRNCSSGIEPVFKKAYERTVKLAGSTETTKYTLYHQAVQDCIDAGGNPDIFIEANDVDPHKKIDLQAALQKHIDHSISVTTNLPAGTTKETVSKLYLEAFKKGCKGFTIYVDGSRSGILTSQTKETDVKPKLDDSEYIERPKTTDVDIFKTKYKDNMYMILVGKLPDGTPIECFGGLEDGVSLPTKYEKATLVKKSRGHYTLNIQLSEDEEDILRVNNISNRFPAKDLVTITRMVSLALRHRIPVSDIVEQLQRGASSMYDAPAVFARVLKNYISDSEFATHQKAKGVVCPKCGSDLIFKRESGCVTEQCTSCNHFSSKCG